MVCEPPPRRAILSERARPQRRPRGPPADAPIASATGPASHSWLRFSRGSPTDRWVRPGDSAHGLDQHGQGGAGWVRPGPCPSRDARRVRRARASSEVVGFVFPRPRSGHRVRLGTRRRVPVYGIPSQILADDQVMSYRPYGIPTSITNFDGHATTFHDGVNRPRDRPKPDRPINRGNARTSPGGSRGPARCLARPAGPAGSSR